MPVPRRPVRVPGQLDLQRRLKSIQAQLRRQLVQVLEVERPHVGGEAHDDEAAVVAGRRSGRLVLGVTLATAAATRETDIRLGVDGAHDILAAVGGVGAGTGIVGIGLHEVAARIVRVRLHEVTARVAASSRPSPAAPTVSKIVVRLMDGNEEISIHCPSSSWIQAPCP